MRSEIGVGGFTLEKLDPRALRRFGLAFTPDSRHFITMNSAGVLVWGDTRSLQLVENLSALGSNHWALALSPDGRWLATGDAGSKVTVWDWATRRAIASFGVPCDWVGRLRFSRSGGFLLAYIRRNDWKGSMHVWETGQWQEETPAALRTDDIWAIDLSPNDELLAAGYASGAVKLFRFPSGAMQASFPVHRAHVTEVRFTPDGRQVISTSLDGSARVWDVSARRERFSLPGHLGLVGGAALTPDGCRLATGGSNIRDAVKLWDLTAHREMLSLPGEGLYFLDLSFSPDGNLLAATAMSGTANLWRAPSWEEIEAAEDQSDPR